MTIIRLPSNSRIQAHSVFRLIRPCRVVWLLCLLLGCVPVVVSAVELADIESRRWLKLSAPGMVIISDASESQLRKWAAEIELFRRGLQLTLPIYSTGTENPATIFLFRSEGALKPFLPVVDGKPARAAAFFNSVLGHNLGAVSLGGSRFDTRERIYHEIAHWHMQKAGIDLPLWLHEGVAQIYQSFTLTGDKLRLGHHREGLFEHVRIAGTPPLAPLIQTAELDISSAGFKHGRTDLFYAQSWSLAHMLVFGAEGGSMTKITNYIAALRRGAGPEEAFVIGFGMSLSDAHARLDTYIRSPRWRMLEFPINRAGLPEHKVSPVSASELDGSAALLLLAAGHKLPAQQLISRLLNQTPDDPFVWELQAALMMDPGPMSADRAVGALARAYQLGSRNPITCCLLGYFSLENGMPVDIGTDTLGLFHAALLARPGFMPAYEGIAASVLAGTARPSVEVRRDVLAGLVLAPTAPLLNLAAAHLEITDGKKTEAQSRLTRLLAAHPDLSMQLRQKVGELLAATESRSH